VAIRRRSGTNHKQWLTQLADTNLQRVVARGTRATQELTRLGIAHSVLEYRLPVVIDSSAASWPMVYCSAGQRGLELELAPADLIRVTDAQLADIAAGLDVRSGGADVRRAGTDVHGAGPR
jgi:hypothetical protein